MFHCFFCNIYARVKISIFCFPNYTIKVCTLLCLNEQKEIGGSRARAVPVSLFADYADTMFSRLLKRSIPDYEAHYESDYESDYDADYESDYVTICNIHLVKLFVSETYTYTYYCSVCTRHDRNGGWMRQKVVKIAYCKQDNYFTLKFFYVISKIKNNNLKAFNMQ